MELKKIVIGLGGSSGSIYAKGLFERLLTIPEQWSVIGVTYSQNAITNWQLEIGSESSFIKEYPYDFYQKQDFDAPFASGSAAYDTMIICPCSMGLLGRIANGISDDLMTRAADVMLKEKRKLILVPRETPYNMIHLQNMLTLAKAGAIICPASPSFYSQPSTIKDLVSTVVDRVLTLAGLEIDTFHWGEDKDI